MRPPYIPSDPKFSGALEPRLDAQGPLGLPARSLGVVALVLFALFAAVVARALWPVQLLDPIWQLKVSAALINAAVFALLGLALLQLITFLNPDDPLLERRHRICSRLAVAAALGFLLMVPFYINAGLHQNRTNTSAQALRIRGAERQLASLRQAVAAAASNAELNQQLQALDGPVLGPADLAQTLPLLKAQVQAVLQQAEQQIVRERQLVAPVSPWQLMPDLLCNSLAFLALAVGFAALAQRPGQSVTLLQEWQLRRQPRLRRQFRRPTADDRDKDFVRQLMGPEDQD